MEHKIAFIKEFVPENKKIILIGHSIGAYIVLELLKYKDIQSRVTKSVLLFPTIENMAVTPNGRFWTPITYYLRHPFALVGFVFSYMPEWVKRTLIEWRTTWKGRDTHPTLANAFMNFFHYTVLYNALYMGASEMENVSGLGKETLATIQKNLDKITFYYGGDDKWVPPHFWQSMKERFPDGDIRVCRNGFAHDFVVDSSEDVAELVWHMVDHLINTD